MSKPIVAVDIDDVLASFNDTMRVFVNKEFGTNHTTEDYMIPGPYWGYWEQIWDVDQEEATKRYQAFITSGGMRNLTVHDGSVDVLKRLQKKYGLVVVTARGDEHIQDTHSWLETYFPKVFESINFVPVWSKDKEMTKAQICQEIGASYLLDDNIEHCTLAAEAGLTALLFGDYGWNKTDALPETIIRLKDWAAVAEYFGV